MTPLISRLTLTYRYGGRTLRSTFSALLSFLRNANHWRLAHASRAEARRSLRSDPQNSGSAWSKLGRKLASLEYYDQAAAAYEKALALDPDDSIIWTARREAIESGSIRDSADESVPLPTDCAGWEIRAAALFRSGHIGAAADASDRALELESEHIGATRLGIHCRVINCDWRKREMDLRRIEDGLKAAHRVIRPLDHRTMRDSDPEHLLAARLWSKRQAPPDNIVQRRPRYSHGRIRIAYISTDFVSGAVASLIMGCFEQHDKNRFETAALSLTPGDGSGVRDRIAAAFDRFIHVSAASAAEIAEMIRELEIDILINLNGHPGLFRSLVFAHRAAPIQVNYLGYPGTMGLSCVHYILADRFVIPEEHRVHYTEQVVYLPHCYLPTTMRGATAAAPARSALGLPEKGFVFAALNETQKITPEMFDIWMRLLDATKSSILWLRSANVEVMDNLQREALGRGITPNRLVFKKRVLDRDDYLASLGAADLFLDTLPYNAHATACDALWAGLPVLTCLGNAFPGRVGASVLHAIGLPELVTTSLADYEQAALGLSQAPERLAALKSKLMRNRKTEPLFDTARFTQHMEAAYSVMWERQQMGLPPASFSVDGDAAAEPCRWVGSPS